jgi:ABC-type lipoprotein export system ATPase subunit
VKENKEAQNIGSDDKVLIKADNLVKIYKTKETEVLALQGLDLSVERGELTAIIGNSGSGKSTFLNMIGGLDRPSAGSLFVAGGNLFTMSEKELVRYKRNTVGFVWQNNGRNMLPFLSALENVMMPMYISSSKKKREKAMELLEMVGMAHKKANRMNMLSGGEQQRVAIARALVNNPGILLADEPTGNLDNNNAWEIMKLLEEINARGTTVVVVTHNMEIVRAMNKRVITIQKGNLVGDAGGEVLS